MAQRPLGPKGAHMRQMKEQEELSEFERFEAVHGKAVLDEVLKAPRESKGPNWRPSWMEGMSIQNEVREILQQLRTANK
jgi:hypothetical protein